MIINGVDRVERRAKAKRIAAKKYSIVLVALQNFRARFFNFVAFDDFMKLIAGKSNSKLFGNEGKLSATLR